MILRLMDLTRRTTKSDRVKAEIDPTTPNKDAVRTESDLAPVKSDLAETVNTPAVSNTDPARRKCRPADPKTHPAHDVFASSEARILSPYLMYGQFVDKLNSAHVKLKLSKGCAIFIRTRMHIY